MIQKNYKIKVGIEEYPVKPIDVERIARAMQTDEIVKLENGLFRGKSIIALIQEDVYIEDKKELTYEEKIHFALLEAKKNCQLCKGQGYVLTTEEKRTFMKECQCQNPNNIKI